MKLQDIGFYTLSDERVANASEKSPLWRCELILTDSCNFKCPYCRGLRTDCAGTMPREKAHEIIDFWIKENLQNVRFSGGEPTLYPYLNELVRKCNLANVKRIAISTNGSRPFDVYEELIKCGVNDFSISLDACCASFGKKMSGGIEGAWERVIDNIRRISKLTYVTTGIVFTEENTNQAKEIVEFAHSLGVADIRIISSAQYNKAIGGLENLNIEIINKHPILRYRINNAKAGRPVRGLKNKDNARCPLALDDMAVAGEYHFPCIIYMREGGKPIGKINDPNVRKDRRRWAESHNCFLDKICRKNCLDVCVDYNNRY